MVLVIKHIKCNSYNKPNTCEHGMNVFGVWDSIGQYIEWSESSLVHFQRSWNIYKPYMSQDIPGAVLILNPLGSLLVGCSRNYVSVTTSCILDVILNVYYWNFNLLPFNKRKESSFTLYCLIPMSWTCRSIPTWEASLSWIRWLILSNRIYSTI